MHLHRLTNWGLAALIVGIYAAVAAIDTPTDHHAEQAHAVSLSDAQREAQRTFRRDMAAAALCREEHGEAGFTWSAAGQLVCIPRKGKTRHIITANTSAKVQ